MNELSNKTIVFLDWIFSCENYKIVSPRLTRSSRVLEEEIVGLCFEVFRVVDQIGQQNEQHEGYVVGRGQLSSELPIDPKQTTQPADEDHILDQSPRGHLSVNVEESQDLYEPKIVHRLVRDVSFVHDEYAKGHDDDDNVGDTDELSQVSKVS